MIRISATATHGIDDRVPICFVLYAQGESEELTSFAMRIGLDVMPSLWNGEPLAAIELMVRDVSQPQDAVLTILAMFEQLNMEVNWLQDLAPDMPYQGTVPNVFPTKAEFLQALSMLPSGITVGAHDA